MKRTKTLPWIIGILLATLLFAALLLVTDFRYSGSDDAPILRSFMGYEGGVPARFHLYLHTVFAWLLHGLALLFPGVAWFSILQLFLLWLSCAVIGKSCVQAAGTSVPSSAGPAKRGLASLAGLAAAMIFLLVFGAYVLCRISYTTTAALLGAAAVAQLLSVDAHARPGRILRGMGLSVALLLCCYCLRQMSVLPPLAFWALGLGGKILARARAAKGEAEAKLPSAAGEGAGPDSSRRSPQVRPAIKPLVYGALLCALCFGAFAGLRAAEISARGLHGFLDWQKARIQLFDYSSFNADQSPETLEKLGWSPAKMKLVANWFFMDSDITAEAFRTLYEAQPEAAYTFGDRAAGIPLVLDHFGRAEPPYRHAVLALLALWVYALLAPTAGGRRAGGNRPAAGRQRTAILLALPLGALMLFYLAYQGRLPLRAAASALLPLGAFLCVGLWPRAGTPPDTSANPTEKRAGTGAMATVRAGFRATALAGCLVLCALSVNATAQRLLAQPNPEAQDRLAAPDQLDEFAVDDPDVIIIYDLALGLSDGRLFPDTSGGIPGNTLFWGGWPARSPSWLYQLAQYGIDGGAFTAHDFLRENLVLASTDGEPWQSLVTYVSEIAGPVDWEVYGMHGYVTFFQLYEEDPPEDFDGQDFW